MVKIVPPPPTGDLSPLFYTLRAGTKLVRIFDPTRHGTTALTFRSFGPLHRFDHHRGKGLSPSYEPCNDIERSINYAALTLSGCLVEVFGDAGVVEVDQQQVARPTLTRDLQLLDIRGSGAMRAGSNGTLAKVAERPLSQA